MTARHPIRNNIHPVPLIQEIQRRLRDADVRFDAHDGDLVGLRGSLR